MNILLYTRSTLPVGVYGGTERVVWDLMHSLTSLGHKVTLLAGKNTKCNHARVIEYQPKKPLDTQIPDDIDIIHFHSEVEPVSKPYVYTQHGNSKNKIDPNTIFVSQQHAINHGASAFVHNGLNWDQYPKPNLKNTRERLHFLGKAAWRVKNVQGAINISKKTGIPLDVLGGYRVNIKMGLRITISQKVRFWGMVDDQVKSKVLMNSGGLVFPVTWHEPFGLAIIESLFFGCPIFATPYGSIPEIVINEVGFLSAYQEELVSAVRENQYLAKTCHDYAQDCFNSKTMALAYLEKYNLVLNGKKLNPKIGDSLIDFKNLPYFKS